MRFIASSQIWRLVKRFTARYGCMPLRIAAAVGSRIIPAGVSIQAWGTPGPAYPAAAPLRAWAERIAQRRGRSIAAVALARRLAGILYALWRDGKDYRAPQPAAVA